MRSSTPKTKLTTQEIVVFGLLGGLMLLSKRMMEFIPNVHLLGLFLSSFTLAFRKKALIPLYVFVLLDGLLYGFSVFWLPGLYIWLPLWLGFLHVGRFDLPRKIKAPLYMTLCGLHGLLYGTLYAPFQALVFGLNFPGLIAWIVAGIPFDIIHGVSNFIAGMLIIPLAQLLQRLKNE